MNDGRKPRLAKVHSQAHADAYLERGWVLRREFRVEGDDQPYEYLLEWPKDSEPATVIFPKPTT